jgi:hypothetical protein
MGSAKKEKKAGKEEGEAAPKDVGQLYVSPIAKPLADDKLSKKVRRWVLCLAEIRPTAARARPRRMRRLPTRPLRARAGPEARQEGGQAEAD